MPQTRQAKHRDLLSEFRTYGATQGADVDALMDGADVRPVVALLRDFGQHLWRTGRPRLDYVELLNAVWHLRDGWRRLMSGAA